MRIKEVDTRAVEDLEEVEDVLAVAAVVEEVMVLVRFVTGIIMMHLFAIIVTQDICKAMAMVTGPHHLNSLLNSQTLMAMEALELNGHLCLKLC
jgi:hypothetical protein